MTLGLSLDAFTILHVIITLIAIVTGFVVMLGMPGSHRLPGWTAIFLLMTVLTSVTGFMFPIHGFTPALGTGVISMVLLVIALLALYVKHLAGAWRWIYVVTALASLYLNVAVLIVQSFQKISVLNPQAPQVGMPMFAEPVNTQFVIAELVVLAFFVVVGLIAAFKFRPGLRLSV